MVVFVFGLAALLFQRAGDWLEAHDSAYYWLSDRGFRFLTNCAEALFLFGPVTSICGGMFLGMLAVAGAQFKGRKIWRFAPALFPCEQAVVFAQAAGFAKSTLPG
jgi:hypothetical protein